MELNINNIDFQVELEIINIEFQNRGALLYSLKRELFGNMVKKLRLNSHFSVIVNHFSIL